jgi:hypothetical protein
MVYGYSYTQVWFVSRNNELVASETDAYAIADFINVSLYLFAVRLTAISTYLYIILIMFYIINLHIGVHPWTMFTLVMYNCLHGIFMF